MERLMNMELTMSSTQPLDNKTLNRLESAVAKSPYVGSGKKLKVKNQVRLTSSLSPTYVQDTNSLSQVNPDIVGGLIVEVGDRTIDLSVSSKLAKLNKLLTDAL